MHPIYTNYRADFVETARGCVSSAFSPTASAKLGSECAVPAWARPPRTAVGRNCPRFDCGFRVGAALVAARPSDRAAGGARSNQALPKRFSSCWRVSSMATGRPWGQYLLPGGPVRRGPREDSTSSGQVNCPCGKVFASGENTWTRQRREARSNQALPKRFSSCWRVSSMATGRPWGQYLLPGGPVRRGPREDSTSSGQVNCPCGKVFASGENTWTRQRREARSNQALPKRFSSCWRVSSMATGRP